MTINLSIPTGDPGPDLRPRITVIGCGGAGGNAVNNMIRSHLEGVEFIAANTDAQAITQSSAERRIQLGVTVTQGLGAGSRPDIGRIAAEEALEEIIDEVKTSNMVFIAAGMGGGTGTGAAPVIARAAREQGILTVGVVTKPFHFEGAHRMRIAEDGIEELEKFVDTLIIIPNQNLFRVANERTTFADAFKMADDVLYSGVRGVTDLMVMPGLINLDFADIRAVMSEMGKAMMGTGEAEGERRSLDAAEAAISNPLLDDVSMKGARGVLINITGGSDMTLFEVDEAANRIRSEVDPDAFIIFGSTFDDSLEGRMRVSVVATGMDAVMATRPQPTRLNVIEGTKPPIQQSDEGEERQEGVGEAAAAFGAAHDDPAFAGEQREVAAGGANNAFGEVASIDETPMPQAATASGGQRASIAGDSFIPPMPVSRTGGEGAAAMHPFPSAPAPSGAQEAEEKADRPKARMSSLIARVAGVSRGNRNAKAEDTVESIERREPEVPQQQRLGGVDPKERLPASQPEDDLLDIPAFLRRQAN